MEVHRGEDNVARVATVKTAHGVYKRSIRKLCVLSINYDDAGDED
jgi:hypothetical protein